MNTKDIRRQLEAFKAIGGSTAECADVGMKLCNELDRHARRIAELSQMSLFGDVKPPAKTPIGT